jgi:hypothetical protein
MAMTKTSLLPCPRCDGSGYIQAFSHIKSGRCFLCGGAGDLGSFEHIPATERQIAKNRATQRAVEVIVCIFEGDTDLAEAHAAGMISHLFVCGTDSAREVLNLIGSGVTTDRDTGYTVRIPRGVAEMWRSKIVEMGRAVRQ